MDEMGQVVFLRAAAFGEPPRPLQPALDPSGV
jgi:hypothetical protein